MLSTACQFAQTAIVYTPVCMLCSKSDHRFPVSRLWNTENVINSITKVLVHLKREYPDWALAKGGSHC